MTSRLHRLLSRNAPGAALALVTLIVHCAATLSGMYGYFRDEFYYIACTDHLAWGYVDHPPFSIVLLWLNRLLFGDSLFALRFLPAIAGALLVYSTGSMVRELGGGKRARLLACCGVMIAPVYLFVDSFYSMNAFEPLFWMGSAYLIIRILNTGDQKLWLMFGALTGVGVQNKYGMLFFGFALMVGILLTSERRHFASQWFWIGAAVAGILFFPNLLWQTSHDWASLEFMQNAQQWKNAPMTPLAFISAQVLFQHPLVLPLWLAGALAFFIHDDLKKYRLFGLAFVVLFLLFVVQRGKPYYLSPIFPVLVSAGAVALERFERRIRWPRLSQFYAVLLILGGLVTLPVSLPLLPVETYIRYSQALSFQPPRMERHGETILPQVLADRFGWQEMVAEVARVYESLSPEDRAVAAIYTQNYGEAGAIDFFGGYHRLPKAVSGHNSYWHWGLRGYTGDVLIIVGGSAERHRRVYESVVQVSTHRNPYAMPFETDLPIYVCRKPKVPIVDAWNEAKRFI